MSLPAGVLKPQVWAFHVTVAGAVLALVAAARGRFAWALAIAVAAVASDTLARRWSRRDPTPMPYWMRWILSAPRPFQSGRRLATLLGLRGGERVLEIGPGTGKHALPTAAALGAAGRFDALDIQREMLERLAQRAARSGIENIVTTRGDARALPYPDATFDGAYVISVLGEIPDQAVALRELRRVLKPAGRLVIGEVFVDPDFIRLGELQERAAEAGLALREKVGSAWAYMACFERAETAPAARAVPRS